MQVSVGRLGIITQVKLPIKAQKAVKRSLDTMSMDVFTQHLVLVEQNYKAALQSGDEAAVFKALEPVEAVQVGPKPLFWGRPRSCTQCKETSTWKQALQWNLQGALPQMTAILLTVM